MSAHTLRSRIHKAYVGAIAGLCGRRSEAVSVIPFVPTRLYKAAHTLLLASKLRPRRITDLVTPLSPTFLHSFPPRRPSLTFFPCVRALINQGMNYGFMRSPNWIRRPVEARSVRSQKERSHLAIHLGSRLRERGRKNTRGNRSSSSDC